MKEINLSGGFRLQNHHSGAFSVRNDGFPDFSPIGKVYFFQKGLFLSKGFSNQIRPAVKINILSDFFSKGFEINQIFPAVKINLNLIMKRAVYAKHRKSIAKA